jgi:hypothetical protein
MFVKIIKEIIEKVFFGIGDIIFNKKIFYIGFLI